MENRHRRKIAIAGKAPSPSGSSLTPGLDMAGFSLPPTPPAALWTRRLPVSPRVLFSRGENGAGICEKKVRRERQRILLVFQKELPVAPGARRRVPKRREPAAYATAVSGRRVPFSGKSLATHIINCQPPSRAKPNYRRQIGVNIRLAELSGRTKGSLSPFPCHDFTREENYSDAERTVSNKGFENRLPIKNDTTARLFLSTHSTFLFFFSFFLPCCI